MMTQPPAYPAPRPTRETAPFWEGLKQERLLLPYCPSCGRWHFYPRPFCPHCLSEDLTWQEAAGRGRVHSFTVCHVPAHPAFAAQLPYTMAFVDLEEGVRLLGELIGEPPRIGAPVQVAFQHREDGVSLPVWHLVAGG